MLVALIPLLMGMILAGTFIINQITKEALNQSLNSSLQILSHITAEAVKTGLDFGDDETVAQALKAFETDQQISFISVVDEKDKEVYHFRKEGYPDLSVSGKNSWAESNDEIFIEREVLGTGGNLGRVYLGISLEARDTALRFALKVLIGLAIFGLIFLSALISIFVKRITNPIDRLIAIAGGITQGDINQEVVVESEDEIGNLTAAFGDVVEMLGEKAAAAEEIAAGNLSVAITVRSEADILSKTTIRMRDTIIQMLEDLKRTIEEQKAGNWDARCHPDRFRGAYAELLTGINQTLDAVIAPTIEGIEIMRAYGRGDLQREMRALPGKQIVLTEGLNGIRCNLSALINESVALAQQAKNGNLNNRGDAAKFDGDYRQIIEGFNETLDALTAPMNMAAEYIERIAKGDIPPVISLEYKGDFNKIKDNLNTCITAINTLIEDANMLIEGAVAGNLQTRADIERHQGDFRRIVQGINNTLDAVTTPLNEVMGCLENISHGDLTHQVNGDYQGDFAHMKDWLNAALNAQNEILNQFSMAVNEINSGAGQVSASSQSVSQGATETASSLEQTTTSMTQISGQSRQNAETAAQANQLSASTRKTAVDGDERMSQMLQAMSAISSSSKQISKIIKVIDEIAFQTNLLALNAAVEAARAGVHGKGFAVVAEEVRNLAQRSAKAAKETETLIEDTVQRVSNGSKIADDTAQTLKAIIAQITNVSDLISEIASASREQVQGMEEIDRALRQIDHVTQANTASAEESASAAEELSNQSRRLKNLIRKFHLRQDVSSLLLQAKYAEDYDEEEEEVLEEMN